MSCKVIITPTDNGGAGLFGGMLLWAVELVAAHPNNKIYFESYSDNYKIGSSIPENEIFQCILDQQPISEPAIYVPFKSVKRGALGTFENFRKIFKKQFSWKPELLQEVESFCSKNDFSRNKTVGIHFRGTDKPGDEGSVISPELVCEIVLDYLKTNKKVSLVFITSDEESFINLLGGILDSNGVKWCTLDDPARTKVEKDGNVPVFRNKNGFYYYYYFSNVSQFRRYCVSNMPF
jgi:hypothetical protein